MVRTGRLLAAALALALPLLALLMARADGPRPLSEADLLKLVELQISDQAIVARVEKAGVGFRVDDAVVGRLKKAGASDVVLESVRKQQVAAPPKPSAEQPGRGNSAKDDPPGSGRIAWDFSLLEKNEDNFACMKRTVKEGEIAWVVQIKSDQAEAYVRGLNHQTTQFAAVVGGNSVPYFYARFLDPDDVQIEKVRLEPNTNDVFTGQNVRLMLKLPGDQVLNKVAKVTLLFEKGPECKLDFPLPPRKK
jgi:hypothetical protein